MSPEPATSFPIDPRLTENSMAICDLALSQLRLMNDARFPWLLLIPQRDGARELVDLPTDDQVLALADVNRACAALRATPWPTGRVEKLNVAALGNMVPQLHIHIIGRRSDDPAWPGPVWGVGTAIQFDSDQLRPIIANLRQSLTETTDHV